MCKKGQTFEEIIAGNSAGMSDDQKAEYWWEVEQQVFAILGKVDVTILPLDVIMWCKVAQTQYPTLDSMDFADAAFYSLSLTDLQDILIKDYTNIIKYIAGRMDCDKYANELYSHLYKYYGINAVVPVWGQTTQGYHGFNLAVVQDGGKWIARLIEPQRDAIFVEQGPLGKYSPVKVEERLGVKKLTIGG
jgi:hypothetical protein